MGLESFTDMILQTPNNYGKWNKAKFSANLTCMLKPYISKNNHCSFDFP